MNPCRVEPLTGEHPGVKCFTHRTDHTGHTAKFATELTVRAESQRRAWDDYFGYFDEIEIVPTPPAIDVSQFTSLPVNSNGSEGKTYVLKIVNRLQEKIILWHKDENGEEAEIITIPTDKTAVLNVIDNSAYVLRAEDRAIMDVIPPVVADTHKVVL